MFKNILKYISLTLVLILPLASCQKTDIVYSNQISAENITKISEEILNSNYEFFKGNFVISEEQRWTSKYQDASHGEGRAVFNSSEYLVYDPNSQKFYIIARSMTYDNNHKAIVNDMHGNYIQASDINAIGNLDEFYGNGFVINQNDIYTIDFSSNPVRIDASKMIIFTMPEVNDKQWVEYHSTADNVRLGDAKVFPPDSYQNKNLSKVTLNQSIGDFKAYENEEKLISEDTSRVLNVNGKFDYAYEKIDAKKALDEINRIYENSNKNIFSELIGDSSNRLDNNWKDVLQKSVEFADTLDASVSANKRIYKILTAIKSTHDNKTYTDEQIAYTVVTNPEINNILINIKPNPAQKINALEKAVITTSDQEFIKIFDLSKPILLETLESYSKNFQTTEDKLAILNLHLSKQKILTPEELDIELNQLFMYNLDPIVTINSSLFLEICFHNMYTFSNLNEPSSKDAQRYIKRMFQTIDDEIAMNNFSNSNPE